MPLYTFLAFRHDHSSLSFAAEELADDNAARLPASRVLASHTTAAYVTVYEDKRAVSRVPRARAKCGPI